MKIPIWGLLLGNVLLFAAFASSTITSYQNDAEVWWIWGAISLYYLYVIVKRFNQGRKNGWGAKEFIQDQKSWNISKTSGYISYLYLMLLMLIGVVGDEMGYFILNSSDFILLALISGMFLFAVLQVFQSVFR